jgi:hypothetical protein
MMSRTIPLVQHRRALSRKYAVVLARFDLSTVENVLLYLLESSDTRHKISLTTMRNGTLIRIPFLPIIEVHL